MKKLIVLFLLCNIGIALFAQIPQNYKGAEIKFQKLNGNLGNIKLNTTAVDTFFFTNIGKSPLIIQEALSSCECTTAEAPKAPILPGQKDKIIVRYKAENLGNISKWITVISNAYSDNLTLQLKGKVIE